MAVPPRILGVKTNLHPANTIPDDNVHRPPARFRRFVFLTQTPLDAVIEHLHKHGQKIIESQIERTGTTGPLRSVYIYDPAENLIEIRNPR